jgi:hypothetical protein
MTAIRGHGNVNARMAVHGIFDHMMLVRCILARILALTLVVTLALATAFPASAGAELHAATAGPTTAMMPADQAMPNDCSDCPQDSVSPLACMAFCASAAILPVTTTIVSDVLSERHEFIPLPTFAGHGAPPELHPPRHDVQG